MDTDPHQSYLVDFFNVNGGREHDYSLHGPPGTFVLTGGKWTPPAKGTLAGENVGLDEIYDDPVLGSKGYTGGYMGLPRIVASSISTTSAAARVRRVDGRLHA